MDARELLSAIGEIDESYIEEAAEKPPRKLRFRPWAVGTAAAALLLGFSVILMRARLTAVETSDTAVYEEAAEESTEESAEDAGTDGAADDSGNAEDAAIAEEAVTEAAAESADAAESVTETEEDEAEAPAAEGMEEIVGTANPFTEYAEAGKAASAAGFAFDFPQKAAGGEASIFSVIPGTLFEVIFTDGNGEEIFRIRKGTGEEDISGDYNNYSSVRTVEIGERSVTLKGEGDAVSLAVWTESGFAYALEMQDRPMNAEDAELIITGIDA